MRKQQRSLRGEMLVGAAAKLEIIERYPTINTCRVFSLGVSSREQFSMRRLPLISKAAMFGSSRCMCLNRTDGMESYAGGGKHEMSTLR